MPLAPIQHIINLISKGHAKRLRGSPPKVGNQKHPLFSKKKVLVGPEKSGFPSGSAAKKVDSDNQIETEVEHGHLALALL
jgi:hypothetical protein